MPGVVRSPSGVRAPAPPPRPSASRALDWAVRTCDAVMKRSPVLTDRWHYDVGLVLSGFESVWRLTGDRRYLDYVKSNVDRLVGPGGVIKGYERDAYNLDDVNMGNVLFALHADAKDAADRERYRLALYALRAQLATPAAHRRRRLLAQEDLSRIRSGPTACTWRRRSWPGSRPCSASPPRSTTR